jgi:uncharacterized pyridoxal phosphate-containing UPF0001 family protein
MELSILINITVRLILLKDSEISMGMSGDYSLAIKNGTNMVRVGSLLFGARNN